MRDSEDRPDPRKLLEAFVASNRSEKAFTRLVDSLNGLVFSSALRRTGDAQLAEEITQNVFAVMARKAASLRRHPSLAAWTLETTRLQCKSAMRGELRRRRKIAALAEEAAARNTDSSNTMNKDASWQDAVPYLDEALDRLPMKDRVVILERFYEGRKFREIAERSGQTEAACKMRVKRALDKVSGLLRSRGVTFSAAALASVLGTEIARAGAAPAAAVVGPKVLAAASSISAASILANTIQTMSATKTASLAAAVVFALGAIPFVQQRAEGRRLQSELDAIAGEAVSPEPEPAGGVTALRGSGRASIAVAAGRRTASNLLVSLDHPLDNHALIRALLESFFGGDTLQDKLLWSRIARLSREEHNRVLDDLKTFPCEPAAKDFLEAFIAMYAPTQSPWEDLERMIAEGRASLARASTMELWASSDPEAALQWYREKSDSGGLNPGLDEALHNSVFSNLVLGLASSSPDEALALYTGTPREWMPRHLPRWLSGQFAYEFIESGDDSRLVKLLEHHRGDDREAVITGAFDAFAGSGKLDAGLAFLERHEPDPAKRRAHLAEMVSTALDIAPFRMRMGWLLSKTPAAEVPEVMDAVIAGLPGRKSLFQGWLGGQDPGPVRDRGYATLAVSELEEGRFEQALGHAENIGDASVRAANRLRVGRAWLERDEDGASRALPADLLEQVQDQ